MSTLERFRNPSGVQFIDTIEDLIAHSTHYLKKLPKSDRFIWVTDMCSLIKNVGLECVSANAIKSIKTEQDFIIIKPNRKNITRNRRKLNKLKVMEKQGKITHENIDMIFKTTYGNFDGFNAYQTKRNYKKTYINLFGGQL